MSRPHQQRHLASGSYRWVCPPLFLVDEVWSGYGVRNRKRIVAAGAQAGAAEHRQLEETGTEKTNSPHKSGFGRMKKFVRSCFA